MIGKLILEIIHNFDILIFLILLNDIKLYIIFLILNISVLIINRKYQYIDLYMKK